MVSLTAFDEYQASLVHLVENLQDVPVEQLDATAACGGADFILMVGAVDVDISIPRVPVASGIHPFLQSTDAEDPGGNKVFTVGFLIAVLKRSACWYTPTEDHAFRLILPNLLLDAVKTPWCAKGVLDTGGGINGG